MSQMNNLITRISEIYPVDERFRVSYFPDLTPIMASIKKIGLVHPLILTVRDGKKVIVCGWKRYFACEKLSLADVPALILSEQDDLEVFNLAVFENASFRKFDAIEKAEVIAKWNGLKVKKGRIIRELMPFLGIPPTQEYFDLFYSISDLNSDIKREMAHHQVDLKVLAVYLKLDPPSRKHILPFLLTLSRNKQKELLVNLLEITLREDITSDKLLSSDDIQDIIQPEQLSVRQRAEKLSVHLKKRRYPVLSGKMERFAVLSKKTGLQSRDIDIRAADYFEDEKGVTFSFIACDKEGYSKKIKALSELSRKNELSELFKLISNEEE